MLNCICFIFTNVAYLFGFLGVTLLQPPTLPPPFGRLRGSPVFLYFQINNQSRRRSPLRFHPSISLPLTLLLFLSKHWSHTNNWGCRLYLLCIWQTNNNRRKTFGIRLSSSRLFHCFCGTGPQEIRALHHVTTVQWHVHFYLMPLKPILFHKRHSSHLILSL